MDSDHQGAFDCIVTHKDVQSLFRRGRIPPGRQTRVRALRRGGVRGAWSLCTLRVRRADGLLGICPSPQKDEQRMTPIPTLKPIFALTLILALAACGRGGGGTPSVDPRDVRATFGFAGDVVEICGSSNILGKRIADVEGPGRCGFDDAVRVYAVSGVALSPPARMQCRTARITDRWVGGELQPTVNRAGETLRSMRVAADYSCRTRNHQPGARLSEHSFGTAIDISAFNFQSGKRLTVIDDWNGPDSGLMRRIFRATCRVWHTLIGPDNDRFHQDHFHMDASRSYGPGTFCR